MRPKKEPADQRIGTLGERVIKVLEQEEDPVVLLSTLALIAAAGCTLLVVEDESRLESVADGFVRTFKGIIARETAADRVIH